MVCMPCLKKKSLCAANDVNSSLASHLRLFWGNEPNFFWRPSELFISIKKNSWRRDPRGRTATPLQPALCAACFPRAPSPDRFLPHFSAPRPPTCPGDVLGRTFYRLKSWGRLEQTGRQAPPALCAGPSPLSAARPARDIARPRLLHAAPFPPLNFFYSIDFHPAPHLSLGVPPVL